MKETEYLKPDDSAHSLITTMATDGHSVGPSSISHCDPSSPSSNGVCVDTDVAAKPSDSTRRLEAGSSCRTSRLNRSVDFRHGVWTRCGRRKRDRILPQSGGEAARIRKPGIVNARRPRRRKGPCKRRQRCPPRPLERPREGTSLRCRTKGCSSSADPTTSAVGNRVQPYPGGREDSERPSIPATLRPDSQFLRAVPPSAQLTLRSQPVLNIPETPATQ